MTEFHCSRVPDYCLHILAGFLTSPGPILCPLSVSPVSCPTLIPVIPGFIPHLSCLQPCLVTPPRPIILIPLVHSIGFLCITEFIHFLSFQNLYLLPCLYSFLCLWSLLSRRLALSTSIWAVGRDVTKFLALETTYFVKSVSHMLAPCFLLPHSCTYALSFLLHPNSTPHYHR